MGDVKFSIRCTFKTKLQLKEDKGGKGMETKTEGKEEDSKKKKKNQYPLKEVEMPYILDFDLGPPKMAKSPSEPATASKAATKPVVTATTTKSTDAVSQ